MNSNNKYARKRIKLQPGANIKLSMVGSEDDTREFHILEILGEGGTAVAYKVSYDGSDNNKYLYVLKEINPVHTEKRMAVERYGDHLNIDGYDSEYPNVYKKHKDQFLEAYKLQLGLATGENKSACITTSLPIGLYIDKESSKQDNYALYGLFQYQSGETLKKHEDSSLLELVDIQRHIAETVKAYHDKGYLWLDIKEANVSVVGEGAVESVCMFDFGSLISMTKLKEFNYKKDKDFRITYSPTSSDLLLPDELEYMFKLTEKEEYYISMRNFEDELHLLGELGVSADIFLLGSMFYKRLFGKAPTKEICSEIENGSFDFSKSEWLSGCSSFVLDKIKCIMQNCLKYVDREHRYQNDDEYLSDLNELYYLLNSNEYNKLSSGKEKNYVKVCCGEYLRKTLTNTGGKFEQLQKLRERFNSRVTLLSENERYVKPGEAIESDRLVFLYGEGGMGKSTALYDYMHISTATAVYIELSRYPKNGSNFIFETILNDICNNFRSTTAGGDLETKKVLEDRLLTSMTKQKSSYGEAEYILLLDGYNEISKNRSGNFDTEIEKIINTWDNVRVVVTGRDIPKDYSGNEIDMYKQFRRYKFAGISDEECSELIEKKYPDRFERIKDDTNLWDILHIPMFMGMYLQLEFGDEKYEAVHTRGEILDQFITQRETRAAEVIAKGQTNNIVNSGLRNFLVLYSLPFVANEMDRNRSFFIKEIQLSNDADNAWKVYNKNSGLKVGCLLGIAVPKKPDETVEEFIHKLVVEARYCYQADNVTYSFTHQYFRDYFAAKHIQNILNAAQALSEVGLTKEEQLDFIKSNGLDYTWSDDVCILLGEILHDYKNEPGYKE